MGNREEDTWMRINIHNESIKTLQRLFALFKAYGFSWAGQTLDDKAWKRCIALRRDRARLGTTSINIMPTRKSFYFGSPDISMKSYCYLPGVAAINIITRNMQGATCALSYDDNPYT